MLVTGALLTVVGLAFKVAAVPFHMWVPDTYVGAPVAVAAYLSVVSKAAGFVGLMLVLGRALPGLADVWAPVMAVLAALTMTVGNVLALRQDHAVRLLAWSSVAQAGYILVPFGAARSGAPGDGPRRVAGLPRRLRVREPRRLRGRGRGRHPAPRAAARPTTAGWSPRSPAPAGPSPSHSSRSPGSRPA